MNILVDGQTLQSPEVNRGIGVYFKNVLNNMVKQSFLHNWYITVENKSCLSVLDPWVAERLIPIVNPLFAPGTDYERATAYTDALENIVEEKNIAAYWNPNPLMVNVLFPNRGLNCSIFCTIHDIIPAIMPVADWSSKVRMEYQRRLNYLKDERITLLCNSNATKRDFEKVICQRGEMYVTSLAADRRKFYRKRLLPGVHREVTIVFVGGFDFRKNIDGAVKAFARACQKYCGNDLLDRAVLKIVCSTTEETERRFYAQAKSLGVEERVKLTGFVSDAELAELLYQCDLFFFPSLYEGFGLPILEAMLSGAFVLCADNSSLPEVCGDHAVLCDAKDTENMADKILESLTLCAQESAVDKQERQRYALTYSWQRTAWQTLEAFVMSQQSERTITGRRVGKKKLAIMTPWPLQKSGIANYVHKMLPYLAEHYTVDIFVDQSKKLECPLLENKYGGLYRMQELDRRHSDYDHLLYQIGNSSEYHKEIYQYFKRYPGIAEIHDFILHPFFYHGYFLQGDKKTYRTALMEGYGDAGLQYFRDVCEKRSEPDEKAFPMSHSVAALSKHVIFHNHWSKAQMPTVNASIIPHPCFDKADLSGSDWSRIETEIKAAYHLMDSDILLSCFGFVNSNKRPDVVLEAVRRLMDRGYRVKLVFWGDGGSSHVKEMIANLGLNGVAYLAGYLDRMQYETGLALSDIAINLRYPSMGESSGTLCEAFKYGKPVIVSDINQYREYPDEVCWKVPVGAGEVECLTEMVAYLIDHAEVRQALGQNALAYAESVLSPAEIAKQYQSVLEMVRE